MIHENRVLENRMSKIGPRNYLFLSFPDITDIADAKMCIHETVL